MPNATTAYCQAVEKKLELPRPQRRRLLDGLRQELAERQPDSAAWDALVRDLGEPEETAAALMESVSPETVAGYRRKKRKALQAAIAGLAILLVLFVGLWLWTEQTQILRAERHIVTTFSTEE